jgi:predicted transcriptional regulator with HTH domain
VGAFAIGVPAKVTGSASHTLSSSRRAELARRMIDDLHELLSLRGHAVSAIEEGDPRSFEVEGTRVAFTERYSGGVEAPAVVLAREVGGDPPDGVAVLDLVGRRVHGDGGVVLDSVREFCRKRGIRFDPGPWRYPGGLI